MGTYHVVGLARMDDNRDRMYPAMSRAGMVQEIAKAKRDGLTIDRWYAQTRTGMRILSYDRLYLGELDLIVRTREIADTLPKLPECPVCDGRGCCCCNYAGIAPKGYANRWQSWQLDMIRKDVLEKA